MELSASEMVPETPADDVIDLATFAQTGEAKIVLPPTPSMADLASELLGEDGAAALSPGCARS